MRHSEWSCHSQFSGASAETLVSCSGLYRVGAVACARFLQAGSPQRRKRCGIDAPSLARTVPGSTKALRVRGSERTPQTFQRWFRVGARISVLRSEHVDGPTKCLGNEMANVTTVGLSQC